MKEYLFRKLLRASGWQSDQVVTCDQDGRITAIQAAADHRNSGLVPRVEGILLPGFVNAHSHAFQYAMAGRGERHSSGASPDDFWSWREQMYSLALSVSADELEIIACRLYSELLRHGYTHVAEFHYLHHQEDGTPYSDLAEHGRRLVRAAKRTGIRITLIPMFYATGGFGKNPGARQCRFISKNPEAYFRLLEASEKAVKEYRNASMAMGVHSLRASGAEHLTEVFENGPKGMPFHMHIAEQLREVEEALTYLGKRPVEWLDDHLGLQERMYLVHATHLTDEECVSIANSKTTVILCPSTEGNLGDGLFSLKTYIGKGGQWSIGSDSHIGLNPFEELRWLDYGQRLKLRRRDVIRQGGEGDGGLYLLKHSVRNGQRAVGRKDSFLEIGDPLDGVIMDISRPELAICPDENLGSLLVYQGEPSMILGTMINGDWVVEKGCIAQQEVISADFLRMMKNRK